MAHAASPLLSLLTTADKAVLRDLFRGVNLELGKHDTEIDSLRREVAELKTQRQNRGQ